MFAMRQSEGVASHSVPMSSLHQKEAAVALQMRPHKKVVCALQQVGQIKYSLPCTRSYKNRQMSDHPRRPNKRFPGPKWVALKVGRVEIMSGCACQPVGRAGIDMAVSNYTIQFFGREHEFNRESAGEIVTKSTVAAAPRLMRCASLPLSAKLPDPALWEHVAAATQEAQCGTWICSMEPFYERIDATDGMRVCCEVDESCHPSTHPIGIWRQACGYTVARVNMGKLKPEDATLAAALHQHPWPTRDRSAFNEKGKMADPDWHHASQTAFPAHSRVMAAHILPQADSDASENNARSPEPVLLHRWVCWLAHGPPPREGMHACHFVCNNPRCIRATHLMWQDPLDNMCDGKYSVVCIKMRYSNGYVRAYSQVKRPVLN